MDLCELNGQNYLVISDYYSRFIEILHMPSTTTAQVIQKLKAARFRIPDEVERQWASVFEHRVPGADKAARFQASHV